MKAWVITAAVTVGAWVGGTTAHAVIVWAQHL